VAERWPRFVLLLAIIVALLAGLRWLSDGDDESPAAATAPSVSKGPRLVGVPDVVGIVPGLREEIARAELTRLGFRVRVVEVPAPDAAVVGVTLRQEPEAGRKVPAGTEIIIFVGG
jgi:beta-lactam-binding protein with PASTA domain